MKKLFLSFLTIICCFQISAQNVDRSKFFSDSINNYVEDALKKWHIPGAAVGVIKDGKVVLMKGYGVKQMSLPAKVDQNTIFMIGSNTFPFTATALAILQEEHKLSLNDPIIKYLPDFKMATPLLTQQVTIRDLLAQRVGFGSSQGEFTYWSSNLTRKEVLEKLSQVVPNAGFRTRIGYSDAAYVAAAAVIPKVTGKSWEQYLTESILAPLGMTGTFTSSLQVAKATNKAAAHMLNDGILSVVNYPKLDNIAPATGIGSSMQDMSKWVKALLENGKAGNLQVIPAAAIRSTMSPQMYLDTYKRTTGEMCINLYGLGWFYQIYAGKVLILLDDVGSGFTSIINLVPEQKLGIIVLTNSQTNFFHEALALEILDVYMKRPYQDYSSKFAPEMKSQNEQESEYLAEQKVNAELRDSVALKLKPELNLNNYAGRYSNDLYGNMTITQENNKDLVMRFEHHPHLSVKLQSLGGNRFYAVYSDPLFGKAVFPFEIKDGKVINVSVSSSIEYIPYNFKKN